MMEHDEKSWPDGEGPLRRDMEPNEGESFHVDVAGFEGPLDLLLELARHHKIDLTQISMVALADQYLSYIDRARRMRIEVAADYLVMAAWLAYLKSRLLLPTPSDDDVPAGDMAERLAFRLQRLQAMRDAAARIMARNQLNRDVFARGAPEPLVFEARREYADNLIDLLKAYAQRRQRQMRQVSYTVRRQPVWSIKDARGVLEKLLGRMDDWCRFDSWLVAYLADPGMRASVIASSFTASLELAREGQVELRQEQAFQPIYMRRGRQAA
jgi:segregation and condensation protein A